MGTVLNWVSAYPDTVDTFPTLTDGVHTVMASHVNSLATSLIKVETLQQTHDAILQGLGSGDLQSAYDAGNVITVDHDHGAVELTGVWNFEDPDTRWLMTLRADAGAFGTVSAFFGVFGIHSEQAFSISSDSAIQISSGSNTEIDIQAGAGGTPGNINIGTVSVFQITSGRGVVVDEDPTLWLHRGNFEVDGNLYTTNGDMTIDGRGTINETLTVIDALNAMNGVFVEDPIDGELASITSLDATAGNTSLFLAFLPFPSGGSPVFTRVVVGEADSGGEGYRLLRVSNDIVIEEV